LVQIVSTSPNLNNDELSDEVVAQPTETISRGKLPNSLKILSLK
jgi:hypothetical protein